MAGVKFSSKTEGGLGILGISGSIDAHVAPEFDKKLKELLGSTNKIIVDVSNLDYIATAGLGVLMASFNSTKSGGGNIILCGMSDKIKKVFDTMGFSKVLKITADQSAAKAAF